jgi:hypothetical protein
MLRGHNEFIVTVEIHHVWLDSSRCIERRPVDRQVRDSNPSHDTMAHLLGRRYEFPQCKLQ